jgi:hypothetical protein
VNGSFTDYQFIRSSIDQEVNIGLLGTFKYSIAGGKFLRTNRVEFMDYKHFNGNLTWFSSFRLQDFPGLDYYSNSTTLPFIELHAEQQFKGFLLNKIPGIRKLKLNEVVSFHAMAVENRNRVMELAAGLEKLNLFRVQVFSVLQNGKFSSPGVVIGIKTDFGQR